MKKIIIALVMFALPFVVEAGAILVFVKMPDGKVMQFEDAKVSTPDKNGYFFFKVNKQSIWVHCSNVWFMKK